MIFKCSSIFSIGGAGGVIFLIIEYTANTKRITIVIARYIKSTPYLYSHPPLYLFRIFRHSFLDLPIISDIIFSRWLWLIGGADFSVDSLKHITPHIAAIPDNISMGIAIIPFCNLV